MTLKLLPSFARCPVFPYFAACMAAAAAARNMPCLRRFETLWWWAAAGFVLAEISLACFCYFGANAAAARKIRAVLRCLCAFFACMAFFYLRTPEAPQKPLAPGEAQVSGRVAECSVSASGAVYGAIEVSECSRGEVRGRRVWFTVMPAKNGAEAGEKCGFQIGDEVSIFGVLRSVEERPPRSWGFVKDAEKDSLFNRYLRGRFIYYKIFAAAQNAKILRRGEAGLGAETARWAGESLGNFAFGVGKDSPSARSLRAMILGDKSYLSPRQKEAFRNTGTMHIFAVSGLHVGILACGIYFLCALFMVPFKWRIFVAAPVLLLYVLACGAPPSAVRAFFMACAFLLAFAFSRGSNALNALMLSALAAFAMSPEAVFSAGFQLSYAVVAVMFTLSLPLYAEIENLYLARPRGGRLEGAKFLLFKFFACGVCISVGASLAAMPISAYWFGMFPLSGMAVSPVFVLLATAAVYAAFAGMMMPPIIAGVFNSAAAGCMWVMSSLAEFIAENFPAVLHFNAGGGWAVFFAEIILICMAGAEKLNVWLRFCACAAIVALTGFILWNFL